MDISDIRNCPKCSEAGVDVDLHRRRRNVVPTGSLFISCVLIIMGLLWALFSVGLSIGSTRLGTILSLDRLGALVLFLGGNGVGTLTLPLGCVGLGILILSLGKNRHIETITCKKCRFSFTDDV